MLGRATRFWLTGFLIFVMLVAVSAVTGCGKPTSTSSTSTSTPIPVHRLQVQDLETGQAVENAVVRVRTVGAAVNSVTTDENGQAEIDVGSSDIVELVISADGYKDEERYINLAQDAFPRVVFLKRLSEPEETDIPSPAPTGVIATPLPAPGTPPTPTPMPTATPTLQPTFTPWPTSTSPPRPTPTPTPPPIPLSIRDLWPTGTVCQVGSLWSADLWVQPVGGDGSYTYYIDGNWQAGPTAEGMTIHITRNTCIAIVGTMTVESGGQIESREFYIDVPDCCE